MYAVVRTGGKQYKVTPGDNLEVEKLAGDVGDSIVLEDVLMVAGDEGIQVGQPNVEGASVTARITGQHRGEKILVFRYRPKKRVRVRRGHRQYLTRLQILKISGEGYEYVKEEKEEATPEKVVEAEVEEEIDIVDKPVEAVEAVSDLADEAVDAVAKNLKGLVGRGKKASDDAEDNEKKEE